MIKKFKIVHNGVNYINYRQENFCNAVFTDGETKTIIEGKPKIALTSDSWKYDKELQFSLCSLKGVQKEIKKRNKSKWEVSEINMPIKDGIELINFIANDEDFKKIKEENAKKNIV